MAIDIAWSDRSTKIWFPRCERGHHASGGSELMAAAPLCRNSLREFAMIVASRSLNGLNARPRRTLMVRALTEPNRTSPDQATGYQEVVPILVLVRGCD